MKAWRIEQHGAPSEALALVELPAPEPAAGQLRVRVAGAALNWNDIDACRGQYRQVSPPLPYTPGMEVMGEVDAVGEGCEAWLGRRVVACPPAAFGGYAEQALAGPDMTFDAPPGLDDDEASAFFFPFHLAHLSLHERAGLRKGETLLVHAAAGGLGSAALQLGVAAGARVIATAGGEEKLALCRELGADLALDYREGRFDEAVLDATEGRGVDVVCDPVGGEVAEQSFRCIARNGRHVMVGFSSGGGPDAPRIAPRPVLMGNFGLLGVLLAYSSDPAALKKLTGFNLTPRDVGEAVHRDLLEKLEAGVIRPIVGATRPFTELPEALEEMARRETLGRTVLRLR
ncbi:MAG: NADPH:quinone oxidoreductase family protein [Deltaproteobacteria bacterium]|nr:NADPH:quinone oxidoreductase family protein [Deltaproteobacteria bacterium]MBW2447301.1 NADPH:quinone oxidoreductase family protein [Deltaproteobacteria bacterium]